MTKLVSFSAGLDSTWIMYQLLCKAPANEARHVRPAYFSMWNGGNANFMEILCSVAIVERLMDRHHAQTEHVTWAVLGEENFPPVVSARYANGWSPLVQQGNVVNGLAKLMCGITRKQHHAYAVVGWNKLDALENSLELGDWTLDEYARLKNLYSELMYFQDHAGRVPPLLTPAWDKEKLEMWQELPEDIRRLVQVSNYNNYEFAIDRENNMLIVYAHPSAKSQNYRSLGITPSVGWEIKINDAYRRVWCSALGGAISAMGLDVPTFANFKDPKRNHTTFTVTEDTERLFITSFTAEEWCEYAPHFKALQEKEKERANNAKASKAVDAPTGEVADS